ncbi:phosphotransferase [Micromonospora sp. PLK6-60]|uniref:phosphotransferase n=1 Tax=Micromonospora sp. PLK6-60 TaxID=2873383 RepID=UPI001CA62F7E|nr:phosphotransferase [Micromonospora sp. PLK6-60]MBY8874609.1 phosphotransferase [Micromonospora sp. PLK6-60]
MTDVAPSARGSGPAPGGAPLASGREADVYPLGPDRVLRRYRHGGDVGPEVEVMTYLHRAGYPVPLVHSGGAADLVLERLSGPTMAAAFLGGALDVVAGARILADLHRRLHALPARRSSDPGVRVLHLDLHPENVLLTPAGPVVIDWRNSDEGPPALDRAMSALILAEVATEPGGKLVAPAGALLAAFLAEVGPATALDRAVTLRTRTGPHGPARLTEAAALVRAAAPR